LNWLVHATRYLFLCTIVLCAKGCRDKINSYEKEIAM
jgi:hypothetical protein